MPIIQRIETDMFVFAEVMDIMVNPTNLMGVPGAGLALEYRKRVPDYVEPYREACRTKELRIGTVQMFTETGQPWALLNFPTKRHYQDQSSPDDIKRGLQALRELLQTDRYRFASVGMPMLGCGLGMQDYDVVYPMMEDALGDLEACVFVSMSPNRTTLRPKYLTVAGPMDYGINEEQQKAIEWGIDKVMEAWKVDIEDYTNIVSGGYPGVDAFVCGTEYGKAVTNAVNGTAYQDTLAYKKTDKIPIVIKPNTVRNGVGANLHLGNLLCEISEDIILFKPKGHNNNRLSAMQAWIEADKEKREREGLYPRRVAIFGEVGTERNVSEDIVIPQLADIPY